MKRENHTSTDGHVALALMSGVAIGVAVGMLFAPTEGRRLRRQIRDGAERVSRETASRYHDASHAVSDLVARGRRALDAGRQSLNHARGPMRPPTQAS